MGKFLSLYKNNAEYSSDVMRQYPNVSLLNEEKELNTKKSQSSPTLAKKLAKLYTSVQDVFAEKFDTSTTSSSSSTSTTSTSSTSTTSTSTTSTSTTSTSTTSSTTPVPNKYYWTVRFDNEDWYSNPNLITTAKLQSTAVNSMPTTWSKASANKYTVPGTKGTYYVIIVPNGWDYPTLHNPAGGTIGITDKSTVTISGKTYKIGWSSAEMDLTGIYIN